MVFRAGNNIAPPVAHQLSASDLSESAPYWHVDYLVDNVFQLGRSLEAPGSIADFIHFFDENEEISQSNSDPQITIDLGKVYSIGRLELYAAKDPETPIPFVALPQQYKVELLTQLDPPIVTRSELGDTHGSEKMHWHALDSHDGRYLRLTFIKLPVHSQRRVLALGEIRVIGDRRGEQGKLAFGKDISIQNFREDEVGNTSLLIDGFTNGRKLVSEKLYVEQLAKRSIVEQAYSNVVEQLAVARASRIQRYWFVGIIAAVLAVFSLLLWLLHLKNHRKRAVFHIQQQIAADLHDDISGNLGTISMITNRLRDMTHDTGMKEKLREVLHLSQESYISVKEIIWHADSETTHLSDLFEQIRRTARSILSDLQVVYEFPDEFEDRVVASKARRDIILLVKESLYNCAKYAKAEHITIKAKTTQSSLLLTTSVQLRASFEAI